MFADKLRLLRKQKAITQEQLAKAIGVERSSIGKYEGKKQVVIPSNDVLKRIANYFGVSLDYLLENETENKEPPTEEAVDQDLMNILLNLSPDQLQRVKDFLAGMTSTNTTV